MNYLLLFFNRVFRSFKYRALRPPSDITPATNPKAYWNFAIQSVLQDIHERNTRWTWPYIAARRYDRKMYVKLWKLKRTKPKMELDDASLLASLEERLSYEDIRFYRSVADMEVRKEASAAALSKASTAKSTFKALFDLSHSRGNTTSGIVVNMVGRMVGWIGRGMILIAGNAIIPCRELSKVPVYSPTSNAKFCMMRSTSKMRRL